MIKKPGSDKNILKNYRPISQLTAFSKLLERIVSTQIISHLLAAKVLHPHQSAYMPELSTETALCRINDNVLNNKTVCFCSLMLFLDLSATFDTINHKILIQRLIERGFSGKALDWLTSYIFDRMSRVSIGDYFSEFQKMTHGVPQGSVLGPLLFRYTYHLFSKSSPTIHLLNVIHTPMTSTFLLMLIMKMTHLPTSICRTVYVNSLSGFMKTHYN